MYKGWMTATAETMLATNENDPRLVRYLYKERTSFVRYKATSLFSL